MKLSLLLWLALLLPLTGAGATGIVALGDTARRYELGRYWSLLPVRTEQDLTLAQVQAPPYAGQFRPSLENFPRAAADTYDYWLRCQVRNEAGPGTAWVLEAMPSSTPSRSS